MPAQLGRRSSRVLSVVACALFCAAASTSAISSSSAAVALSSDRSYGLTAALLDEVERAPARSPEQARAEEVRLQAPSATAERKRSQSEFGELGGGEVQALLGDQFASQLALASAAGVPAGSRVQQRIGQFGAAVVMTSGERRFVSSPTPLSTPDENGVPVAVDLSLGRVADGWRPTRAAAELVLPDQLDDGVRLSKLGIAVRLGQGGSAVKVTGQDAVVYPDAVAGGDADFVATPTTTGVETFIQVRSPRAAETAALQFTLPAGAALVGDPVSGQAHVVRDGSEIATVLAPIGVDAQGRPVATTMTVAGNTLVLSYPHRDADLAYPLLIDPNIVDTSLAAGSWASHEAGWF